MGLLHIHSVLKSLLFTQFIFFIKQGSDRAFHRMTGYIYILCRTKGERKMYEELRLNIVAEEPVVYHTYKDRLFLFCGAGAEEP